MKESESVQTEAIAPTKGARLRKKSPLRAALWVGLVAASLGTYSFAKAGQAEQKAKWNEIGKNLKPVLEMLGSDPYRFTINGQSMWVSHQATDRSTRVVLDEFERHCDGKGESWSKLFPKQVTGKTEEFGVLRDEKAGEGFVLCFERTEKKAFKARVDEFFGNADLGAFGKLRFGVATRVGNTTSVFGVLTEGPLSIDKLFVEQEEDVPGGDNPAIARPADAKRILVATVDNAPYALRAYESKKTPEDARSSYDADMEKLGWKTVATPVTPQNTDGAKGAELTRGYLKDGIGIVMSASTLRGRTVVTLNELGSEAAQRTGSAFAK